MGINVAILLEHATLPSITNNPSFGKELDDLTSTTLIRKAPYFGIRYLGQYHGNESLPIMYHEGRVWSTHTKLLGKSEVPKVPPEGLFTILDLSCDLCSILSNQEKVGEYLAESLRTFTRDPNGHPVYLEPYGQALAIVHTFSSDDIGMVVLEGGCSWLPGKEATPEWSSVRTIKDPRMQRDVLELTLALKQNVRVNLASLKLQQIIRDCF